MKLILLLKLDPNNEQKKSLLKTIKEANNVCNELSEYAFKNKCFSPTKLHNAKYYSIRENYKLSSEMIENINFKVADSYKHDKKEQRKFREFGSIIYDPKILTYNIETKIASIRSIDGRLKIPFIPYQEKYLPYIKGEADLIYRKNKFYLFQTCDFPEEDIKDVEEFIGCAFG